VQVEIWGSKSRSVGAGGLERGLAAGEGRGGGSGSKILSQGGVMN
jgi:hypothetical protein